MNNNIIISLIGIILFSSLVFAGTTTVYNPFTSALDFVQDLTASISFTNNVTIDGDLYVYGETGLHDDLTVEGDVGIGQQDNQELFYIEANGTNTNVWAHEDVPLSFFNIGYAKTATSGLDFDGDVTANDDFQVLGTTRISGISYIGSTMVFGDNTALSIGSYVIDSSSAQTQGDALVTGVSDSRNLIYTDTAYKNKDHDRPTNSDATSYWFATEDVDVDNTKWGSLTYSNQTDNFQLNTGEGSEGVKVLPELTSHNTLNAPAGIDMGETDNPLLFKVYQDEDFLYLESTTDLPVKIVGDNAIYLENGGYLGGNSTCIWMESPGGTRVEACD